MPSKLLFAVLLLAGCKEKAADPPAKPAPTQPADPAPAARKAAAEPDPAPKPEPKPTEGSGSGSASADAPLPDETVKRTTTEPGGERKVYSPQAAADKLKKRAAELKARQAAEAKKQQP